jgi:hypothetical protein
VNAGPEDRIIASSKNADPTAKFSYAVFLARFIAGHLFAYPLAFVWSVASMPLVTHLNFAELERFAHNDKAVGEFVLHRVAWPAGVVFVLLHIAALIWAIAQKHPRAQWAFFGTFGVILASGVLFGAASWIWLLTL